MEHMVDRLEHYKIDEWTTLLDLQIPQKICHLLWLIAQDVLPSCGRLRRKVMDVEGACGICAADFKENCHIFLNCPFAKQVWIELEVAGKIQALISIVFR